MATRRLLYGILGWCIAGSLCVAAWATDNAPFPVSGDATADKPQSKCWHHDGSWWAILSDGVDGARFYRLGDDGVWVAATFPDALVRRGASTRVDVVSNGDRLTVLAWDEAAPTLQRYDFEPWSGVYRRRAATPESAGSPLDPPAPPPTPPGFPLAPAGVPVAPAPGVPFAPPGLPLAPVAVPPMSPELEYIPVGPPPATIGLPAGHETATVAVDSRGFAWVSAVVDGRVLAMAHGTSKPAVRARGVGEDDISAVVAFGGAKPRVGVFWSDQNAQALVFAYRDDADPLGDWNPREVVARGGHVADDHINMATASDGTLFVVTKTSVDDVPRPVDGPTQAQIILNVRAPDGAWSMVDVAPVTDVFTSRPIVVLDEDHDVLYVAYRHGDDIVYRSSRRDVLDFTGPADIALSEPGVTLRNVTGPKDAVGARGGLLIMATGSDGLAYSTLLPLHDGARTDGR